MADLITRAVEPPELESVAERLLTSQAPQRPQSSTVIRIEVDGRVVEGFEGRGHGTTIVNALAKQLHATVHVEPGGAGTSITVERTKPRLVGDAAPAPEVEAATPRT